MSIYQAIAQLGRGFLTNIERLGRFSLFFITLVKDLPAAFSGFGQTRSSNPICRKLFVADHSCQRLICRICAGLAGLLRTVFLRKRTGPWRHGCTFFVKGVGTRSDGSALFRAGRHFSYRRDRTYEGRRTAFCNGNDGGRSH